MDQLTGRATHTTTSLTASGTPSNSHHHHHAPSPRARAALSLHRAYELSDPVARGRAIDQHFEQFPLASAGTCRLR